jgi:hypothetical protein
MYNDQTVLESVLEESKEGTKKEKRKTANPLPSKNDKVIEQNNIIAYSVVLLILHK